MSLAYMTVRTPIKPSNLPTFKTAHNKLDVMMPQKEVINEHNLLQKLASSKDVAFCLFSTPTQLKDIRSASRTAVIDMLRTRADLPEIIQMLGKSVTAQKRVIVHSKEYISTTHVSNVPAPAKSTAMLPRAGGIPILRGLKDDTPKIQVPVSSEGGLKYGKDGFKRPIPTLFSFPIQGARFKFVHSNQNEGRAVSNFGSSSQNIEKHTIASEVDLSKKIISNQAVHLTISPCFPQVKMNLRTIQINTTDLASEKMVVIRQTDDAPTIPLLFGNQITIVLSNKQPVSYLTNQALFNESLFHLSRVTAHGSTIEVERSADYQAIIFCLEPGVYLTSHHLK